MQTKIISNPGLRVFTFMLMLLSAFSFDAMAQPFVTVWKTDNGGDNGNFSANNQVRISCTGAFNYTYTGTGGNGNGTGNGNTLITFPAAGIYTISIVPTGVFELHIRMFDAWKLLRVEQWGNVNWGPNMSDAFDYCVNLTITATDIPDFSAVTRMDGMFRSCQALATVPGMNSWNVAAVNNMSEMFQYAYAFNQNISNWQTSSVRNMSSMFMRTAFNRNIGGWNTSAVIDMYRMFYSCTNFNQDISNWQTSSVTNMLQMFYGATSFNQDISSWNTTAVINMESMFNGATAFNQDLSAWSLNSIVTMANAFDNSDFRCVNYSIMLKAWADKTTTPNNIVFGASGTRFSPNPIVVAARNALLAKGWTITDAGVGICSFVLPVDFGNISASFKNNQLSVLWSTQEETNNSHFEVELSKDGVHFVPIGSVKSKAVDGRSDQLLKYEFTANQNAAMVFGWGLLGLGLGVGFVAGGRKKALFMALLAISALVIWAGCSKQTDSVSPGDEATLYTRIAQVDQDGTKSYSKVVRVVRE